MLVDLKHLAHWTSIINLHHKKAIFLFDSFGIIGLRNFIIQTDENIVQKVAHGIKTLTQTNNKITIGRENFPGTTYSVLEEEEEISNLNDAFQDLRDQRQFH